MTSWHEIVEKYGPQAYRTAWRILGHEQDCEDVLQDVFTEAHNHFQQDRVQNWRAFLNRMVTFRSIDSLRLRRQVEPLDHDKAFDWTSDPQEAAIQNEGLQWLRSLVADLPSRQSAVFCMAHFDELSHPEIAEALAISLNAVAMALHKARVSLQASVRESLQEKIDD